MRTVELNIAWRYLSSKKGHNAINVVTAISVATIAVVTAAMVIVLSVMNGFGDLVEQMFSRFDPELKIVATDGRLFERPTLPQDAGIADYAEVVSGQVLVEYEDRQLPCTLMGVDSAFERVTEIDSIVREGQYILFDGAFDRAVLGQGLAARLQINSRFVHPLHIYAPIRTGHVNMLRPDKSFHHTALFMSGQFAVNQTTYDDQLLLVRISLARELLEADSTSVSALFVRLEEGTDVEKAKARIQANMPDGLEVQNRYEQQGDYYRILRIEKWMTALLLLFILIIACFNLVGSLTMIRLDKRDDTRILGALGMSERRTRRIHILVGVLISAIGAGIGILIGLALCWAQIRYGVIKLGDGTDYVISAYPVAIEWLDLVGVALVVNIIGLLASWIASFGNTTPTSD